MLDDFKAMWAYFVHEYGEELPDADSNEEPQLQKLTNILINLHDVDVIKLVIFFT